MLSYIFSGILVLSAGLLRAQHIEDNHAKKPAIENKENFYNKKRMHLTPVEDEDLWSILAESHFNVRGEKLQENLAIGAWSHIMLENAHGRRVWNNNLGNVGNLPSDPPADYYSHFGKAKYRSFGSIINGAEAYWNMLYRCPMAVKYFKTGFVEAASLSLKRCNYYRSDQETYSQILKMLYERGSRISRARNGSR